MVYRGLKEQDGYTIVEILISLAIVTVIISLVSVSFIFISKRMIEWRNQISFYNQFMISNNQIYNDLINADYVSYSDSTLSLLLGQKQREYSWTNGKLKLNNDFLGEVADSTWLTVQEIKTDAIHTLNYWITYKRNGRVISDSAIIQVREPIEWSPVNDTEVN